MKTSEVAKQWYREKEGVLVIWLVAMWSGVSIFFLYLIITGQITREAIDFYGSFSYLPGTAVLGIFVYGGMRALGGQRAPMTPPAPPGSVPQQQQGFGMDYGYQQPYYPPESHYPYNEEVK